MTLDESLPIARRRALPGVLTAVLRAAHDDEKAALGPQRRGAYLLTRQVIAALLHAGYPARVIARELGLRTESVRTRAQAGRMNLTDIALLAGVEAAELRARCERASIDLGPDGAVSSDDLPALLLGEP
ncbi:hypothetical protein [Leifsonia shinshuensis]|uniref:hypothetical protein n=1 Tax=Leifsonia shinshuensis TaxID=150026 RepID=UPI002863A32C|nr:hypothetical protein [Leifsonia shinshuensis]MDR6972048.1 hypothetical protein [Leifsonia shinshuensis]